MRTADDDLTARARIRDAAIDLFGRDGFGVGLRAIAAAAGVSLGLIRHHFGSKDGLRAACDEHVLEQVRELGEEKATAPLAAFFRNIERLDSFEPLVRYLLQSLRQGGPFARTFLDRMSRESEQALEQGVAEGTIKASVDPAARARAIVVLSLGALLLEDSLTDGDGWRSHLDRNALPLLELYAQGLLTDRRMLDAYLEHTDHTSSPTSS